MSQISHLKQIWIFLLSLWKPQHFIMKPKHFLFCLPISVPFSFPEWYRWISYAPSWWRARGLCKCLSVWKSSSNGNRRPDSSLMTLDWFVWMADFPGINSGTLEFILIPMTIIIYKYWSWREKLSIFCTFVLEAIYYLNLFPVINDVNTNYTPDINNTLLRSHLICRQRILAKTSSGGLRA